MRRTWKRGEGTNNAHNYRVLLYRPVYLTRVTNPSRCTRCAMPPALSIMSLEPTTPTSASTHATITAAIENARRCHAGCAAAVVWAPGGEGAGWGGRIIGSDAIGEARDPGLLDGRSGGVSVAASRGT
jgi:hypothetical protein